MITTLQDKILFLKMILAYGDNNVEARIASLMKMRMHWSNNSQICNTSLNFLFTLPFLNQNSADALDFFCNKTFCDIPLWRKTLWEHIQVKPFQVSWYITNGHNFRLAVSPLFNVVRGSTYLLALSPPQCCPWSKKSLLTSYFHRITENIQRKLIIIWFS